MVNKIHIETYMKAHKLIEALAATTKRTEKEQLITDAFMLGERKFFLGAQMAYDVMITYGVKKVAEIMEDDNFDGDYTWEEFLVLAEKLRKRELTGHAARDAIHEAANRCNAQIWNNFYRRILLKDFNCGVDVSTINKVLTKLAPTQEDAGVLIIPEFSCQLAKDGAKPENEHRISGRKMLDIKLDGVRLLTILDKENRSVTQYTRNGKPNENFKDICDALLPLLDIIPASVVLDGEIVSASFQELMKQVNRQKDAKTESAKLALFDIIPLADFRKGKCIMPQDVRHEVLSGTADMLKEMTGDRVYVIPKVTVDLNTPEGKATFAEFNRAAIEAGYEGIMVKDPDAPYETKRTFAWLKIKPFIEVSLEVKDIEEGEGKYVGMLGVLLCEGEDDGKFVRVGVGSGLSDEQRAFWWKHKDQILGFIVEVRADCFTQNEKSDDVWSLRFPRFKGVRGTKPGEKL